MRRSILLALPLIALASGSAFFVFQANLDKAKPGVQKDDSILVTTNQVLTPYGKVQKIEGARAKDLALSPGGRAAVLCNGRVAFFAPDGEPEGEVKTGTGPVGIVWTSPAEVWATGNDGHLRRLVETEGKWSLAQSVPVDTIPKGEGNPQVTGLAYAGGRLYVALGRRNVVLETEIARTGVGDNVDLKVIRTVPTEAAPYRLMAGQNLVAAGCRGVISRYQTEPSADSSGTRVAIDPKTDAAKGGAISLWQLDQTAPTHLMAGRQPSGLALSPDRKTIAVASADDDTLLLLDAERKTVKARVKLTPPLESEFGTMPTDVVLSADGKRVFVTCGGLNAVAVVSLEPRPRIEGHIPTGWYPVALERAGGTLIVASSKGIGNRLKDKETKFGVHDNVGTVQFIQIAEALAELPQLNAKVARNNRFAAELPPRSGREAVPIPERVGEPSVFRRVVYIIKENHTYDVTFGDMKEGNGDPTLCTFPEEVTPNQHALAREFVLLDNTYTSGTNSADGHQWTSSAVANAYTEQNYAANARSYPYDGGDPLAFSPEGFLWTAAMEKNISVRVYGEFVDKPVVQDRSTKKVPTWKELWDAYKSGEDKYDIRAETSQAALRKVLHPRFIGFPSIVSDQWRADQFLAELKGWEQTGGMPQLCILLFPNDHTSGTTPGMPTPRAAVADNDLALGRVVEAITKSRFWADTLILVIEDDSQLGLDHVDGHRTIAQVISPYTKRGAVVSNLYNHTSFIRSMGLVLGFPALTRFDRTATSLSACFTDKPDLAAFAHRSARVPLDDLNPPKERLRGEALRWAAASEKLNWKDVDLADAEVVARAVWHAQHPKRPFPKEQFRPNRD